jgi:hypothetical protein
VLGLIVALMLAGFVLDHFSLVVLLVIAVVLVGRHLARRDV